MGVVVLVVVVVEVVLETVDVVVVMQSGPEPTKLSSKS